MKTYTLKNGMKIWKQKMQTFDSKRPFVKYCYGEGEHSFVFITKESYNSGIKSLEKTNS